MKTHYGHCDRANESDNTDYWSNTYCGLEEREVPMTDEKQYVTCKHCLKAIEKEVTYKKQNNESTRIHFN